MRRILVAAALGLGLISGTAGAAPVIGAAAAVVADPVTTVQYRHPGYHRPHHHHRPHYAPPPRPHWHRPHRPHHHGYHRPPPRHYGWR